MTIRWSDMQGVYSVGRQDHGTDRPAGTTDTLAKSPGSTPWAGIDPNRPVASVFFRAVELLIVRVLINGSWLAAVTENGYQTSGIRRNPTLCWYSA